jgi:hypothetical protein
LQRFAFALQLIDMASETQESLPKVARVGEERGVGGSDGRELSEPFAEGLGGRFW